MSEYRTRDEYVRIVAERPGITSDEFKAMGIAEPLMAWREFQVGRGADGATTWRLSLLGERKVSSDG